MAPRIRPGHPDDADFIARTILLAQRGPGPRGWFDIALGRPEPEVLHFISKLAVAEQRSWWHASQFLVVESEGSPAAALCALPSRGTIGMAVAALKEAARETGMDRDDLAAMFARGAYTDACWVQGGDEDWLMEHVASQPSFRKRGLMRALIAHALEAGRAAGFSGASITFLIGNDVAERCYASAGFSFAEEKRDAGFEAITGAPGFRRFARAI
jgi:GNAT superfamily N-acetyltransferase